MSHAVKPIPTCERYFGNGAVPVITAEFRPDHGWASNGCSLKHVSVAWLRKMRTAGITHVSLSIDEVGIRAGRAVRSAEFSIDELL